MLDCKSLIYTATLDEALAESNFVVRGFLSLSSLKMISANHRPDCCRDFSRNRDSVMISDEITVSLLKVSCKNKNCYQRRIIVLLHKKLKGEKTKRLKQSFQNFRQN